MAKLKGLVLPITLQPPWSYSKVKLWEGCPRRAKYKYIDGLKEPGSPQMDRGTAIHSIAENYVTMASNDLQKGELSLTQFKPQLDMLRKQKAQCEIEWGFDVRWTPTGFFAPNAWMRMKTDASFQSGKFTRTVIDHKTGKMYDDHEEQLHLYAIGEFVMRPEVQMVIAQDWYLDQDAVRESVFEREELAIMQQYWEERVAPMFKDTIFPCRPTYACNWCHFRKAKGGPCEFIFLFIALGALFM